MRAETHDRMEDYWRGRDCDTIECLLSYALSGCLYPVMSSVIYVAVLETSHQAPYRTLSTATQASSPCSQLQPIGPKSHSAQINHFTAPHLPLPGVSDGRESEVIASGREKPILSNAKGEEVTCQYARAEGGKGDAGSVGSCAACQIRPPLCGSWDSNEGGTTWTYHGESCVDPITSTGRKDDTRAFLSHTV
jgi:hypothetical protein